MAKIETVSFTPGGLDKTRIINVAASVGANAVNIKEDVIVVQALLKYALEPVPQFRGTELPEPTGTLNRTTAQLIKKYQRYVNRGDGLKVSIDGRIDPVKGGTMYSNGTKKIRTIISLQTDALRMAKLNGQPSLFEAIYRRWSFIRSILDDGGVGELGLSLESSAPNVGSLGLSLS